MKKSSRVLISLIVAAIIVVPLRIFYGVRINYYLGTYIKYMLSLKKVEVPEQYSKTDRNKNGIPDSIDLVIEARKEVKRKTPYKDGYFANGYPPETEGVCTDVIWRAFKAIDINIKDLLDKDIKENASLYWRVEGKPEPNIDFRRVPNLDVFFNRFAESLTKEVIPGDVENLKHWQPGDILVILKPYQHIGIVSDKRTKDGVPYIIHNTYPRAVESPHFNLWECEIAGHYRWKY
jgi:uncharacterized protein